MTNRFATYGQRIVNPAELELAWRNACQEYLHAAFNEDSTEQLKKLAQAVMWAAQMMRQHQRHEPKS